MKNIIVFMTSNAGPSQPRLALAYAGLLVETTNFGPQHLQECQWNPQLTVQPSGIKLQHLKTEEAYV
jgi:hypothetical protein